MTPTEFVAGLAANISVQQTELATVDRALAKQGLRQIARGRSRPGIKLIEGLQIVCAWAGAENLTDAAEEVKRLEQYYPAAIPEDEYELTKTRKSLFGSDIGEEEKDLYGQNFFRVLAEVTRWLGEDALEAERAWVSITKGGAPEISYDWRHSSTRVLSFVRFGKMNFLEMTRPPPAPVMITTSIRGPVLKWIYDVTETE